MVARDTNIPYNEIDMISIKREGYIMEPKLLTLCIIADRDAMVLSGLAIVGGATVISGFMYGGYVLSGKIKKFVTER